MDFEEVVRVSQQRGFFFKSAESYPNTPAGFWDYGPLGVALRNNFLTLWRRQLLRVAGMIEIDGAQILPRDVFEASGHLSGFTDPFVKCSKCGSVFRPDKLIEEKTKKPVPEKLADADYDRLLVESNVRCQKCGAPLSGTSRFNMMFKVGIGPAQEEAYLRPETCQTIFVDFPLLFKTQRVKLPVGVAQVGKSFRNEIAPRQGLLRLREINQAEIEVFFNPGRVSDARFERVSRDLLTFATPDGASSTVTAGQALADGRVGNELFGYLLAILVGFYEAAGIPRETLRFRVLSEEDRAFYSQQAYDLEVKTSVGWLELVACNYRGDYDLSRHAKVSGSDFSVLDGGSKVLPHVFELSMGVDRSLYAILETSMISDGERRLLKLRPYLSPQKVGVFPLVNKDGLPELAEKILKGLSDQLESFYDDSGSIGRRYARADEAGVPFCVTVDYDSFKDNTVTLRRRDDRSQVRVSAADVASAVSKHIAFPSIQAS